MYNVLYIYNDRERDEEEEKYVSNNLYRVMFEFI